MAAIVLVLLPGVADIHFLRYLPPWLGHTAIQCLSTIIHTDLC